MAFTYFLAQDNKYLLLCQDSYLMALLVGIGRASASLVRKRKSRT